jgi:hypothetical protein
MERIEELVGNWNDAEDRLRLELALRGSRILDGLAPVELAKPAARLGAEGRR